MYFGWIPILTNELKRLENLGGRNLNESELSVLNQFIENLPPDKKPEAALSKKVTFDDVESIEHDVSILFRDDTPTQIIIWSAKKNITYLAIGFIKNLYHESGMVEFSIIMTKEFKDEEYWFAKHIYKVIRDLYHRHVYTSGDFGLFPVNGKDRDQAAKLIWDRYYGERVTIGYHQLLKRWLHRASELDTPRDARDALLTCSQAIGEACYSKAMARLTGIDPGYEASADLTIQSFENIRHALENAIEINSRIGNPLIFALTFVGSLTAFFFFLKEFFGKEWASLLSLGITLLFAVFVVLLRNYYHKSRSNISPHEMSKR